MWQTNHFRLVWLGIVIIASDLLCDVDAQAFPGMFGAARSVHSRALKAPWEGLDIQKRASCGAFGHLCALVKRSETKQRPINLEHFAKTFRHLVPLSISCLVQRNTETHAHI